jgi:hypothetical protein
MLAVGGVWNDAFYLFSGVELTADEAGYIVAHTGALTKNAVTRFQKKYQIDPIGAVGPQNQSEAQRPHADGGESVTGLYSLTQSL